MSATRNTTLACTRKLLLALVVASMPWPTLAQTTVGTGSIVSMVSDPSGAVVGNSTVTITNLTTGQIIHGLTNSSGMFNSGALIPGDYRVRIAAEDFRSTEITTTVLVGNTATLHVSLQIGDEREIVEVRDSEMRVNTEQATVAAARTTSYNEGERRYTSEPRNNIGPRELKVR